MDKAGIRPSEPVDYTNFDWDTLKTGQNLNNIQGEQK